MFNPCGQVRPVFVKSAPMPPPILILRDIQLTFGGPSLLEGAAFSVSARDRLCLVGRNGSGKSTLLKIAAGIVTPDDGEVFLQPGTTIRYLPQEPDLSAYATVLSYVEEGLDPGVDHYRGAYLLEQLKVNENADPSTLSGGEARRAARPARRGWEQDVRFVRRGRRGFRAVRHRRARDVQVRGQAVHHAHVHAGGGQPGRGERRRTSRRRRTRVKKKRVRVFVFYVKMKSSALTAALSRTDVACKNI